ncbi:hypothetical protein B0H13DRAFT_2235352 [Mycena leptocephala]|nr:hypothetical protein B0H13DRAFT_2235352 [Mycena leptocephala]
MPASVRQLSLILELFFPPELAVQQAIYVLGVLVSLYPLFRLHGNQLREARRQTPLTGWKRSIKTLIARSFEDEADNVEAWTSGVNLSNEYAKLYATMGLHNAGPGDLSSFLFPQPRPILTTRRLDCRFCPVGDRNLVPSLRRRKKKGNEKVWLLDATFQWVSADLLVGYCARCKAEYYPDIITCKGQGRSRTQVLEYDAEYLRKALQRFHSGWSNFADWFSYRQSQKLFLQHFTRRLLVAHGKESDFTCEAHPTSKDLAKAVRVLIGENGGFMPSALKHGCMDCTHVKRYRSDLVREGAVLAGDTDVAGSESGVMEEQPLPANLPAVLPQQPAPPYGSPRGYTRLAVMDGKTLTHKGPSGELQNWALCEAHLDLQNVCGIIPCGRAVHSVGALTCDDQSHIDWHKRYEDRFHRLSFPGAQRVIRRQNGEDSATRGPSLQVQLQALGDTPGEDVVHSFKAKSIYCLQTIQWACGMPIGWGKCYRVESTPQVLSILNEIWKDNPQSRPSFMVYDKACDLLRHIVTQDPTDLWLQTTKFIVDAWHYIGRRSTDILCRTRCNPAPTNGTQPDLVLTAEDDNGVVHQTRAFNTETAEQLNSWLNGFESQLRQMTDVNYDFFIHVLMMIYGETIEKRIVSKERDLTE